MTHIDTVKRILLFLFLSQLAWGQTSESIVSGRPGVSIPPNTVGTGVFQIQSGLDSISTNSMNDAESLQTNHFFRLGITESFEFNTLLNYRSDDFDAGDKSSGLSHLVAGLRLNILNEDSGWIQALGIQVDYNSNELSADYKNEDPFLAFRLSSIHQLSSRFGLTTNLGISQNGKTTALSHSYSVALSFSCFARLGCFIESFGAKTEGNESHGVNSGFAYIVNQDLQLDISYYYLEATDSDERLLSLGISYRFSMF